MGKFSETFPSSDFAAEARPLTKEDEEIFDPLKTNFIWYKPPLASEVSHTTGGQQWCVTGHDMQVLSMTVPPGETIVTEVGSFMYMHPGMETKVELTLCSAKGCGEGWRRICGGESCVKVLLLNETNNQGYVGLTPNFPAKVRKRLGKEFICSAVNTTNHTDLLVTQSSLFRISDALITITSFDER